jgi:hypothetical protein
VIREPQGFRCARRPSATAQGKAPKEPESGWRVSWQGIQLGFPLFLGESRIPSLSARFRDVLGQSLDSASGEARRGSRATAACFSPYKNNLSLFF